MSFNERLINACNSVCKYPPVPDPSKHTPELAEATQLFKTEPFQHRTHHTLMAAVLTLVSGINDKYTTREALDEIFAQYKYWDVIKPLLDIQQYFARVLVLINDNAFGNIGALADYIRLFPFTDAAGVRICAVEPYHSSNKARVADLTALMKNVLNLNDDFIQFVQGEIDKNVDVLIASTTKISLEFAEKTSKYISVPFNGIHAFITYQTHIHKDIIITAENPIVLVKVSTFWLRDDKLVAAIIKCKDGLSLLFTYEPDLHGKTPSMFKTDPSIKHAVSEHNIFRVANVIFPESYVRYDKTFSTDFIIQTSPTRFNQVSINIKALIEFELNKKGARSESTFVSSILVARGISGPRTIDYTRLPNRDGLVGVQILSTMTEAVVVNHVLQMTFVKDLVTDPTLITRQRLSDPRNIVECITIKE